MNEEEPPVSENPYLNDFERQKYVQPMRDRESVIWQLDLKDINEYLKNILIGYEFDQETNSWKRKEGVEAIVNERGLRTVESFVSTVVNRITLLTNLDEDTARRQAESLADTLALDFYMNRAKYGLRQESEPLLFNQLKWFAFNTLMSSKDGSYQHFMTQTHEIRENIIRNSTPTGGEEPKKRFILF